MPSVTVHKNCFMSLRERKFLRERSPVTLHVFFFSFSVVEVGNNFFSFNFSRPGRQ